VPRAEAADVDARRAIASGADIDARQQPQRLVERPGVARLDFGASDPACGSYLLDEFRGLGDAN
jgi:hypothetical protein